MRVAILTREFPPQVYGGAGVHVDFLTRELRQLVDVTVHCMGVARDNAVAHPEDLPILQDANPALRMLATDLVMAGDVGGFDLVHSHTWYANMAGHWAKLLYDVPHVLTGHSLEPLRPWKAEQLGGGYRLSSWAERTAYQAADAIIAVSHGMAGDMRTAYPEVDPARIHVIHNGVDSDFYPPGGHRARWTSSASTRPAPTSPSSGGSRGRRGSRTCCGQPSTSIPGCSWCCSRERPTPPS